MSQSNAKPVGVTRRTILGGLGASLITAPAVGCIRQVRSPIRVGVLHSLSGSMQRSESPVATSTLLAIDQLNQSGGLLGRRVKPISLDGASDPKIFAEQAEYLLTDAKVAAIFGCWTSTSRKAVLCELERHDGLLFYPVQYEGLEESPYVIYTGATPNQQILPAVRWCRAELGDRFFLVGSDYVFPRVANEIIRDQVRLFRGSIVGESYLPFTEEEGALDTRAQQIVAEIKQAQPSVILNTINGLGNRAFFRALRAAGITPRQTPTLSFCIAEPTLTLMRDLSNAGDYIAWCYFQSLASLENAAFVQQVKDATSVKQTVSAPMVAAYVGVHLWAKAVRLTGSFAPQIVRTAMANLRYDGPGGAVHVHATHHHTWKPMRIGQVQEDGQVHQVWWSEGLLRPEPFPATRRKADWESLLARLSPSATCQ